MKKLLLISLLLSVTAGTLVARDATSPDDTLYSRFMDPPREYRPRVWWHWMNGNITRDGIRKDLEWMDRAGIAGFHNFDAGLSTPQVVDRRLVYMTPEWKAAFNEALDLADSLDMEVTVASSPGWSITGGPWVREDDAEKKLVWRELTLRGGRRYRDLLPEPFRTAGPYQDIPAFPADPDRYASYHDICVLALRLPDSEAEATDIQPSYATSDPRYNGFLLLDGLLSVSDTLRPGRDGFAWVEWSFSNPQTMRSFYFAETTGAPLCLEADLDDDGRFETTLADLPAADNAPIIVRTFDFPETRASVFRLRCTEAGRALQVAEARISPSVRVNYAEEKAGFFTTWAVSDRFPTPEAGPVPSTADVVDLTSRVRDGWLDWEIPEGSWRIWRFGFSLLGRVNGPASPEATGLEVDKLDAAAVRRYYDNYLGMYQEASRGRLGEAIHCLMIDSYESGKGTWTATLEQEFHRRRGYALRPWMPVLTGTVLESAERSEQFLFDWRQTLGELMAENHYDVVNDILAPYGMKRYTEAHERRSAFVGDGMMVKRSADVPMSAIWVHYRDGWYSSYPVAEADIRESASVAHIYGQNVCAAESFTVNGTIGKYDGYPAYQCAPFNLKRLADAAMAEGLNRFVVHTSVHQPSDSLVPGLALGPYGQYFNRHDTWAEEARAWTDYLSRSCYLLQQGRWTADLAWFYGEDKNLTAVYYEQRPAVPAGYNYDFVNADILLHRFRLSKGCLTTPTGMRYRALVIDKDVKYMSLPVLRRIRRFARAGVLVYGPKPQHKAGLRGSERRFRRIADRLWDSGRYPVRNDISLAFALAEAGIAKDADWNAGRALTPPGRADDCSPDLRFVHRHLPEGELYWVANISPDARKLTVSFAVSGLRPEVWHADTGVREEPSWRQRDGRTEVDLSFVRDDAQFILFTEATEDSARTAPVRTERATMEIPGPWTLSFQPGRGAPASPVTMPALRSLSESPVEGIRYFSGTATYRTSFEVLEGPAAGETPILDLGEVHHMARVILNGKDLGLVWKPPYRLTPGEALKEGTNELEIRVTDSWANRLIGDRRLPLEKRLSYTVVQFYTADDEPIPAGLVGPVRLLTVE